MFKILTPREGTNIINLRTCQQLETPLGGPRLLWQLPWACLEHTGHAVTVLAKSLVFQGQSSILSNRPSYLKWTLFLSAVSTKKSVARENTQNRVSAARLPFGDRRVPKSACVSELSHCSLIRDSCIAWQ